MNYDFLQYYGFSNETIYQLDNADKSVLDVLNNLPLLFEKYQNNNLDLDFFIDSTYDIRRRINLKIEHNLPLKFEEKEMKWINMILNFQIFKIGSLRFQYFPMNYQEIEREGFDRMKLSDEIKNMLPLNTPLINVHIERNTNLSDDAVCDSFKKARMFFISQFPDDEFKGFVTRTWLIYPGILDLLSPNSNITKFAQHFKLLASNTADYQALSRVYNTTNLDLIKEMPKTTTLEKKVYQNLDKLGVGFGFKSF